LLDRDWNVLWESYDVTYGDHTSLFQSLPYTGAYFIQASTLDNEGKYTLSIEVGPDMIKKYPSDKEAW